MALPRRLTAAMAALFLLTGTTALVASTAQASVLSSRAGSVPALAARGLAGEARIGHPPIARAPALGASAHPGAAVAASPRQAADSGYTYWGFYVWDAKARTWDYMKVGANDSKSLPHDGDVYGFRWALVVKTPRLPRASGDFAAICARQKPTAGQKRIAFVLDYGTATDAPRGETAPAPQGLCANVSAGFTVQQALQSVTTVRTGSNGLICGISSYPASGCGAQVANAKEGPPDAKVTLQLPNSQTAGNTGTATGQSAQSEPLGNDSTGSGVNIPLIVVAAVVVIALMVGALVLRRRQGTGQ
ncbi:MAG: SCO2322 family protein [Nocardioidaceae bacterium]